MPDCEKMESCMFLKEKTNVIPTVAAMFRKHYCYGEYRECARYYLFNVLATKGSAQGNEFRDKISALACGLLPNEIERARALFPL